MAKAEVPYIISLDARRGYKFEPQIRLLIQRLKNSGYSVESVQFPRIEESSSQFYQAYQNGHYGLPAEINPYLGALYATLDRLQATKDFQAQAKCPDVLLIANFVCSTLIDEASKITNSAVRQQYCQWLVQLEHFTYGVIYPDLSILLDDSPEVSGESSLTRQIASFFPDRCQAVSTHRGHQNLTVTSLNNTIWELITSRGPIHTKTLLDATQQSSSTDNVPWIGALTTETHLSELINTVVDRTQGRVASSEDDTEELTGLTLSSRREGVVSGLGSIDNISGFHLFVGNISYLLAERLKGHASISHYQSMNPSIEVGSTAGSKRNSYFIPADFDAKTAKQYRLIMDRLINNYSQITDTMIKPPQQNKESFRGKGRSSPEETAKVSRPLVVNGLQPVSVFCRISLFASLEQYRELIGKLRADDLPEARELAQKFEACITHTYPRLSSLKESQATRRLSIKQLQDRHGSMKAVSNIDVSANLPELPDTVTLLDYYPRNEFQLLPASLFEYSSLSNEKISEIVDGWSYDKKVEVLRSFFNHGGILGTHPENVLKNISYSWELVSDFLSFQQLHHSWGALAMQYQTLTPRYGYDIPPAVETTGLSEQYQESFDLSYQLFSVLQRSGYETEAQYATLLGHRLRWTMATTARQMMRLHDLTITSDRTIDPGRLISLMWDHLSEVHPLLAECLLSISSRTK